MLSKDEIGRLKEAKLRQQVIIPLLEAMGYGHVVEYHGPNERGKDVVGCIHDERGRRTNLAVVAKAVQLSGKASVQKGSAAEVLFQILQCFNDGYLDTWDNEDQSVREVWVVTNKALHPDAQKAINSALSKAQRRRVRYFDIDKLWAYYDEHMRAAIARRCEEIERRLNDLDPHYAVDLTLSGGRILLAFREAFPGAAEKAPFVVRGELAFPETDEGRNARADYERFVRTGTPVRVPGRFLERLEFPPVVNKAAREVLGMDRFELGELEVTPVRGHRVISLGIEIENRDGETFTIPRTDLRFARAGTDEEVWDNEHEPGPFAVSLVRYPAERAGRLNVRMRELPLTAVHYLSGLHLYRCVSKPAVVRATALLTGFELPTVNIHATLNQPPGPGFVRMIADLAVVQRRTGVPIPIREGQLSEEDRAAIELLRALVRGGGVLTEESDAITVPLRRATAENVLRDFAGGRQHAFLFGTIEQETLELFGVSIPVGTVQVHTPRASLANDSEVRRALEAGTEPVEAQFRSLDESRFRIRYTGLAAETNG